MSIFIRFFWQSLYIRFRLKIKIVSYSLQAVVWFLFIAAPFIVDSNQFKNENFLLQYILKQIVCVVLFYLNYFYFIPRLLKNKGLSVYLIFVAIAFTLGFVLCNIIEASLIRPKDAPLILFFSLVPIIQVYAVSTTFRLLVDYFTQLSTQKTLEEQTRLAELNFLRSQINPHFLFNTLNNINALIRLRPNEAEQAVGTLSELMRYMLQSGNLSRIEIGKEINYLKNYIELQKLRLSKDFKLTYSFTIENEKLLIEPLLLIGFIENTFKHGVSGEPDDFINISIISKPDYLEVSTKNKLLDLKNTNQIVSGVGMVNTKKRLELCYPNKYELSTDKSNGEYSTKLIIKLT